MPTLRAPRALLAAILLSLPAAAHAQCNGFSLAVAQGIPLLHGATDTGNHCDDCTTTLILPFPITLYGSTYTSANLSSNGNIQFTTNTDTYSNDCLPAPDTLGIAICPHWDDLRTDSAGEGIFRTILGSAPNRTLILEWRGRYYSGGGSVNFEARFYEDQSRFELVYGAMGEGGSGATIGVQDTVHPPTQYLCNTAGLIPTGTRLTFACYNGPVGDGSAFPSPVYACNNAGSVLLSVHVTPGVSPPSSGITVTSDLSAIGGAPTQTFYDDGTHGDETPNDRTFSFRMTVPDITAPGDKSLPYTLADAQGRSTTGIIPLTVNPCASTGPDVIVSDLTDANYYGSVGNISAYSLGTNACNRGDFPVLWIQGGTQHPVIAQNLYRLKDGRFEQIGQSFLKHSFQSLNSPGCATCIQPPFGGAQLGVGCSDVYGAGYNGGQGNLGMRSTCNPTTGIFVWPPPPPAADVIGQRLQVFTDDIDPALNAGAKYFGEGHYVTADDAQWTHGGSPATNGLNNATYQRLAIASRTAAPTIAGPAHAMSPAIQAWKDEDPAVSLAVADYLDTSIPAGIVARFWVGAKATDNGNGTWHYEYAVFNLNADRAGSSFSIPLAPGVSASNIGFHGVFAHSGEPYPNTAANPDPWTATTSGNTITWSCPEAFTPPNGDHANALRWGTLYNFRFDADIAPTEGSATIGLFKPGTPTTTSASGLPIPSTPPCPADFNGDGFLDFFDYDDYVTCFETATCPPGTSADFNHDGFADFFDYDDFVQAFELGC